MSATSVPLACAWLKSRGFKRIVNDGEIQWHGRVARFHDVSDMLVVAQPTAEKPFWLCFVASFNSFQVACDSRSRIHPALAILGCLRRFGKELGKRTVRLEATLRPRNARK